MKILLIGDDARSVCALEQLLAEHEHEVLLSTLEADVLDLLRGDVEACVLELREPAADGRQLIDRVRRAGLDTPILCLTARSGGDTPTAPASPDSRTPRTFDVGEFLSQLAALMRQSPRRTRLGELALDLATRRAHVGSRELSLTEMQFSLLAYLVRHAGEVVTRPAVLKAVFGYDFDPGTNIVDVHVAHLRGKLVGTPHVQITTVRGVGYRLEDV